MNQALDKLEATVYLLAQKFETQLGENRRLQEEIRSLKEVQERTEQQHQIAIDELSEALLVQVTKLKNDLQAKIDSLLAENQQYRSQLEQNASQIRNMLARLPAEQRREGEQE